MGLSSQWHSWKERAAIITSSYWFQFVTLERYIPLIQTSGTANLSALSVRRKDTAMCDYWLQSSIAIIKVCTFKVTICYFFITTYMYSHCHLFLPLVIWLLTNIWLIICFSTFTQYLVHWNRNLYPLKNRQTLENGAVLGESCEFKGGGQEMAAMMLMQINFSHFLATMATFDFTTFSPKAAPFSQLACFWDFFNLLRCTR